MCWVQQQQSISMPVAGVVWLLACLVGCLAGMKVGRALAAHGAMERFAMDFVTVKREDGA